MYVFIWYNSLNIYLNYWPYNLLKYIYGILKLINACINNSCSLLNNYHC